MGKAAHHDHRQHSGAALTDAARTVFAASGEQWTAMRAQVFGALIAAGRPASAYDIADAVSAAEGRRIAANSVYRILDLFVAKNLAHKVESANAYIVNTHPDCVHDCIFLVCDECGETVHVDDDALTQGVRRVATERSFRPVRPVIEVRGTCSRCA